MKRLCAVLLALVFFAPALTQAEPITPTIMACVEAGEGQSKRLYRILSLNSSAPSPIQELEKSLTSSPAHLNVGLAIIELTGEMNP